MRITKEKAAENRARIVEAASRLFRERGFEGAGVDAIMDRVGLTHGGFYRHFASKDDLAATALAVTLATSVPADDGLPSRETLVGSYLSARHRDDPGAGCMVATCGAEVARQGPAARRVMTEHLQAYLDRLAQVVGIDGTADRQAAIATFAGMVGAMVLARAVDDPALSDEILAAARAAFGAAAPADGVTPAGASATHGP